MLTDTVRSPWQAEACRKRDDHDDVDVDGDDKPAHCGQLLKVKGGNDVDDG